MDFGRSLQTIQSATSKANITLIEENEDVLDSDNEDKKLDLMLIKSANRATTELFRGTADNDQVYPSSAFPLHVLERSKDELIQEDALVVIFESFDNLSFVYAKKGDVYHNKNGDFYHDDFIDKLSFGSKLRARNNQGYGFVFLLRPTSELWARSLPHRTQIVYELDSSTVIFQLNLKPNMMVLESGTGSGAMSTGIMRTIAPYGMLHTYEFNGMRAEAARVEFERNKISHLVTVHHRDVCGKECADDGGFNVGGQAADAIFLDLPEPWLAVPHAAFAIKPNGRLCSYSPCVEQAQRCIAALSECGFHSIKTIEVRLRENYVDEVELEMPPTNRVVRMKKDEYTLVDEEEYARITKELQNSSQGNDGEEKQQYLAVDPPSETKEGSKEGTSDEMEEANAEVKVDEQPAKRVKICARPFAVMKGHTAFLTFATASLKPYPDPHLEEKKID